MREGRWFAATPAELPDGPHAHAARLRGAAFSVLAWTGDRLDGALVLERPPLQRQRHTVHLELMVREGQRGQGLGGRLIDAALTWARATPELSRVDLIVFADNTAAVALYRRRGFIEEGRRRGVWREADGELRDDLLMALPLRAGAPP